MRSHFYIFTQRNIFSDKKILTHSTLNIKQSNKFAYINIFYYLCTAKVFDKKK